ncbi:MAG: TipAS antibiotic-recognition domain-containing protein [Clostridia bacterium]|nr:TipAS antibiotic-recognition domain-containing protein [Clostridia bacterium]
MEWITCLRKTLEYIEKNLTEKIDIEEISRKVFVSQYYLQKGFQMITGYSMGEYIRCRRLFEAAKELCSSNEKVIDVALRYGYETPESFSKAFTRFHGASPAVVRKNPALIRTFLPLNIKIEITGGNKMDYVISPMWGFKVIGFERIFDYETAMDEIPKFWDEICEEYCNHTIYAGLAPSRPEERAIIDNCIGEYGVCIDDVGDGKFRYIIAGKYTGGEVPASMTVFEIPQGEWAKFNGTGAAVKTIQSLTKRVFKEWLPGNPDFEMAGYYNIEWYSCDGYKDDENYQCGVWVPVKRYKDEAEKRWGSSEEFKESEKKTSQRTNSENTQVNAGLMEIFARFGKIKNEAPESENAQALVAELQKYITDNFYKCNKEILAGLGQMYVGDPRFKANIDRMGGDGTAEFTSSAIEIYCR